MARSRGASILIMILALVLAGPPAEGQTGKKTPAKKKGVRSLMDARRTADSLNAFHADSLRNVVEAGARADSLRRSQDSLAAQARADSVRLHSLRKIQNSAFGVGERLVFDVSYGFITAGEAVMAIPAYDSVDGRRCYRVEFTVNSLPSFSWVYKVEDQYRTFIDVETIAPWKFEQHIREGSYKRDFIAEFDQVHLLARTTEGVHRIPQYVHDIMSAFYYVRTLDFSSMVVGEVLTLYNFYKDTTYELGVKFLGRQELEVEAGTFKTIVVEPLVKEGGLFKSEGRIVIWLTDDERKLPVRVNTKVLIGSIDTELREYSGLVGPVGARTK